MNSELINLIKDCRYKKHFDEKEKRSFYSFINNKKYKDLAHLLIRTNRSFLNFYRDAEFYLDMPHAKRVCAWLADGSSLHIRRILVKFEKYEKTFVLLNDFLEGNVDSIQIVETVIQSETKDEFSSDYIFGNTLTNLSMISIDRDKYQYFLDKYLTWKEITICGIVNKAMILVEHPKMNKNIRHFIQNNIDSLYKQSLKDTILHFKDFEESERKTK